MLNRIDLLRTVLVAYETLNFREAAIRLSVSPQVVTRAVKELEGHLGELLFHRSTRSVRPSDFCERFVAQARQALLGVDALFAAARPLKDERVEGLVRIAAPTMQGRRFVIPLLERLARQHPGLCFDLRLSDQVIDAVAQRIDVGVRAGRLRDSRFVARTVSVVSLRIVAAPALLKRVGPVESVAGLDTLPTTQLIDRNTGRPWPWTLNREREILPALPAFVTDDAQAEWPACWLPTTWAAVRYRRCCPRRRPSHGHCRSTACSGSRCRPASAWCTRHCWQACATCRADVAEWIAASGV